MAGTWIHDSTDYTPMPMHGQKNCSELEHVLMKWKCNVAFVLSVIAFSVQTAWGLPRQIFVDESASAAHDGESWATAYTNIQDAMDDAIEDNFPDPDEIWIAEGSYEADEGANHTPNDVTETITWKSGVRIFGGFPSGGGGGSFGARNPALYPTILSGDLGGGNKTQIILTQTGGAGNNATLIDGLTLELASEHAIYVNQSQAVFSNIQVTDNLADNFASGAGMSIFGTGLSVTVTDSTFSLNTAEGQGGAVAISGSSLKPSFIRCDFLGNASLDGFGNGGGAVRADGGSTPLFDTCKFEDNEVGDDSSGGAIWWTAGSNSDRIEIRDCEFRRNKAEKVSG